MLKVLTIIFLNISINKIQLVKKSDIINREENMEFISKSEKDTIKLAKKFEKTCEKLIQDMKKYL